MRLTALFSGVCPCGKPVEWDSLATVTAEGRR
jgi:hypothetical protein